MSFIVLIFIVQIVLLSSVFNIYFESQIIPDLESIPNGVITQTKRLVLFVGDGLRADSFFGHYETKMNAPHLREIINDGWPWGISRARVPTESRPGHVAIIAGIYEDPSAVFKGWKENPVLFDTVFNQSRYTFSWGSPDIVPMFSKGVEDGHVTHDCYTPEEQEISGKSGSAEKLNYWVYDKLVAFLKESETNKTMQKAITEDKVIFFLHMLGIDVAGHASKPHSSSYANNIRVTDQIVKQVEALMANYFNDSHTSYLFTSDHGMTDWGSHGAGLPVETETPLVFWGSGAKKSSNCERTSIFIPDYAHSDCRFDINQADIAVLMSVVLGLPIPTNSKGILPGDYLSLNKEDLVRAYALNAGQLLKQFLKREDKVKYEVLDFFFKPFPKFSAEQMDLIAKLIYAKKIDEPEKTAEHLKEIISTLILGIDYYETYYEKYLLFSVTVIFLGVIAFISSAILSTSPIEKRRSDYLFRSQANSDWVLVFTLFFVSVLHLLQHLPYMYYFYNITAIFLWWAAVKSITWKTLSGRFSKPKNYFYLCVYTVGTEIMVISFFYRWILSVGLLALVFWPRFHIELKNTPAIFRHLWVASCCALSVFPFLPTVGTSVNIPLVITAGTLWFIIGTITLRFRHFRTYKLNSLITFTHVIFALATTLNIHDISTSFEKGEGLNTFNMFFSYFILALYFITIGRGSKTIIGKFISICFSLGIPFLLFSTAHESLFPLCLSVNLYCYIQFESVISSNIFYIIFSFFAIGNIDSINSFDINWVRCFVTVFSPFTMLSLILIKNLIPFLIVSCAFRLIIFKTNVSAAKFLLTVLLFCEAMGVQFLFMVKNKGSWLDIGKSLSHYIIMEVIIIFLVILYVIARHITSNVEPDKINKYHVHLLPKWHMH